MPKAPATSVVIHRIELQETERRILEQAVTAYSIEKTSKGIFNLTSDTTTVLVLIVVYEMITESEILGDAVLAALGAGKGIGEAILESWRAYRSSAAYSEQYYDRATSVTGGLRNLLDNIIGALTGEYIGRVQENFEAQQSGGGGGGF